VDDMSPKKLPLLSLLALLALSPIAVAVADPSVALSVVNPWSFESKYWPDPGNRFTSFYYVYGTEIDWWQGGAKFVFLPGSPEYEAVAGFFAALPQSMGLKVVMGQIRMVSAWAHAIYSYKGIVQFKDYMFIDPYGGLIVVDFEHGKSLNVTVYSVATVNLTASRILGYGFANWTYARTEPNTAQVSWPRAVLPKGTEVLLVPAEGIVAVDYGPLGPSYLGGGPRTAKADVKLIGAGVPEVTVEAGHTWWGRLPKYWLFYNASGLCELWYVHLDTAIRLKVYPEQPYITVASEKVEPSPI